MSGQSPEIERLQEQMRRVRASLGNDVHRLVEHTRVMTDWRHYWRNRPWLWCSAAAMLGYLVVPHQRWKHADADSLAKLTRRPAAPPPQSTARRILFDVSGALATFAAKQALAVLMRKLNSRGSIDPGIDTGDASHGR